jgi:putative addiction module antidote
MAHTTKIRAIGNSQGVTLPKAILEKYHLKEGDTLTTIETQDGILLTAQNDTFDKAMEIYRKGAAKYRNAMRELAK